jgi:hypothetical protein
MTQMKNWSQNEESRKKTYIGVEINLPGKKKFYLEGGALLCFRTCKEGKVKGGWS